jgi:hypothetical protein
MDLIRQVVEEEFCKTFSSAWTVEDLINKWRELDCPNAIEFIRYLEKNKDLTYLHVTLEDLSGFHVGISKWGVTPLYWMKLLGQGFNRLTPELRHKVNVCLGGYLEINEAIQKGKTQPISDRF